MWTKPKHAKQSFGVGLVSFGLIDLYIRAVNCISPQLAEGGHRNLDMASSFRRLGDEEKGIGATGREDDGEIGEISASNDAFDAPLNQRPADWPRKWRVSPTFSVAFLLHPGPGFL
ncbi:hypothetical protein M5K25_026793 [Dendrobium thyrsiflorum]|uniref:Uncharacterized protein n=1 Tax=Dendrobium thyrsiflorum TaxID=117978 RepID=A0ABD0TYR2_DENTH